MSTGMNTYDHLNDDSEPNATTASGEWGGGGGRQYGMVILCSASAVSH